MKTRKTAAQTAETRNRTYFRAEHLAPGPLLIVTSVWIQRRGKSNTVSAGYKLIDGGIFRCPRSTTAWLDDKEDVFVEKELEDWKARVNQDTGFRSEFFPDFFLRHKNEFIRWCKKSAKGVSIEGYLFYLGRFVFPFFVQKMRENDIVKWRSSYSDWDTFLATSLESLDSRNKARTALRRYLKFVEAKGDLKENLLMPRNELARRSSREGDVIPGELPYWADITNWLRSLQPGKIRWVLTICAAFGVRISEGLAAEPEQLIGADDIDRAELGNRVIQRARETGSMVAFLVVDEAQKRPVKDVSVVRIVGDVDDEPKTGPYTAGCSSPELGQLLLELCDAKEFEGEIEYDTVYNFIKSQANIDQDYPFSSYSPHDFRRLHITLQTLDLLSFFIVSQLHGQKSEDVAKRYYQWGLMKRRRRTGTAFKLIQQKAST